MNRYCEPTRTSPQRRTISRQPMPHLGVSTKRSLTWKSLSDSILPLPKRATIWPNSERCADRDHFRLDRVFGRLRQSLGSFHNELRASPNFLVNAADIFAENANADQLDTAQEQDENNQGRIAER